MDLKKQQSQFAVDFSHSRHVALKPAPVGAVRLGGDFWGPRLQRIAEVTLPSQFALLESTGRLDNFRRVFGARDASVVPYTGLFFNDSDLYKWLEAASWAQINGRIAALDALVEQGIDLIEKAQGDDGYINTYFSCERAQERWSNLRDLHELYCGGHLIQAAVAHHRATGSTRLLDIARRFADLVCATFGPADQGKKAEIDGHEEIEMALIELARETGDNRYLEQARFFIEARGHNTLTGGRWGPDYFQDDQPFREMKTLHGHAVRALYMACGITDLAVEDGDASLLALLETQWQHLVSRQMYITGGFGSRHDGEALGKDFELPNARAYTETCAAIGSMMWGHRLLAATGKACYADLIEWTLFNGMLPGWGLDGQKYFYVNPLEDDGTHHRQPWYECSCCPPNVARTLAELSGYVFSTREDEIWINLYLDCDADIPLGDHSVRLTQRTRYPWDGRIELSVGSSGSFALALRIPAWCEASAVVLTINGEPVAVEVTAGEYAKIDRQWSAGDTLMLTLPMAVRLWESHPHLFENAGRVALSRGPILYCVEGLDHHEATLADLRLDIAQPLQAEFQADFLGGVVVLTGKGEASNAAADWAERLYRPLTGIASLPTKETTVRAVPYFAWQNRKPSSMAVWLNRTCGCGATHK